jgi:hypothetical protein
MLQRWIIQHREYEFCGLAKWQFGKQSELLAHDERMEL